MVGNKNIKNMFELLYILRIITQKIYASLVNSLIDQEQCTLEYKIMKYNLRIFHLINVTETLEIEL